MYCERRDKKIPVDIIRGQIIDQCVTDNEWFYVTGVTNEIQNLLSENHLMEKGPITVSQYISILRKSKILGISVIINNVNISMIDHLLIYVLEIFGEIPIKKIKRE